MNDTIPFVSQDSLDESILYKPVKKIAPTIFPSIIKDGEEDEQKETNTEA